MPYLSSHNSGAVVGGTINTGMYMFTQIVTGRKITPEGLLTSAATGAVSGAISTLATPLAGSLFKMAGSTATHIGAKALSYAIQAGGEVASYAIETRLSGEEFKIGKALTQATISTGFNLIGGELLDAIPETTGMNTIKQSNYFSPRKLNSYINGLVNPIAAPNAAAVMDQVAMEVMFTASFGSTASIVASYKQAQILKQ